MVFTEKHPISSTEAWQITEACYLVQLSFCVRWALKPEWDYQKLALMKSNARIGQSKQEDKLIGHCLYTLQNDRQSAIEAAARIAPDYRNATFMSCARITALKGFEEDALQLAQLKDLLRLSDSDADTIISIAKHEAQLIRMTASI